ncbi:hypothetical protein [Notoacmeibacter marinus]|uniref:hypothetical protein n=1 Tax=Notoacmeibacter marinus TaxID=1876515 RepID=UPI000DF3628F|nr:hypothetical protein [Notoacmeibacter marinus]
MLEFASTPWHVFSTTLILLSGGWLALIQRRVFYIDHRRSLILYAWHTIFSIYYFHYSTTNVADARSYYINSLHSGIEFSLGTRAVISFTSFFSQGLNLSYGGVFLVFNIIGFVGMLAFASALQQVMVGTSKLSRQIAFCLILLPGLSFWSSAIGKDAITFMGAGMAAWAAIDFTRRYPAIIIAVVAFVVARPHMAGLLLISLAMAFLFLSRLSALKKILLSAVMVPAAIWGSSLGLAYVGLDDASSVSDLTAYLEKRQGSNLEGGSSVDISSMSVPMRMATYIFRPLLYDATGLMALIVSIENLALFFVFALAIGLKINGARSRLDRFTFIFYLSFSSVSWFVLASTTANLGIAIRQKWMFLPMLLLLAMSYHRLRSRHR